VRVRGLAILWILSGPFLPGSSHAATFTVDRLDDDPTATDCNPVAAIDCSLRGAITASNLTPGADTISIPAGVYKITSDGGGELDIRDDVEILGSGETPFVVRRLASEPSSFRLFDVLGDPDPIEVWIENCTIEGGSVFSAGGGALVTNASLDLVDCLITDNEALSSDGFPPNGGGLAVLTGGKLSLVNSSVSGNRADFGGGGIFGLNGEIVVMDSVLSQNQVLGIPSGRGGAIYAQNSEVVVIRSTLNENRLDIESGLDVDFGDGGAIWSDSQLTILDSIINENFASHSGGAIWAGGSVELVRSSFRANQVGSDTTGLGGAIFLDGGSSLDARETLFRENMSVQEAGGIYIDLGVAASLTNVTFSGNTAGTFGGGIENGGNLTLVNATFSNNTAAHGDAINLSVGTTNLRNTLIDGECSVFLPTINSQGGNLESPGDTCFLDAPSDQVGVSGPDLALAALANNGGPTQTHALLPGSVAINGGVTACPFVDQRGWTRIDAMCDVGAFEVDGDPDLIFTDGFESGSTSAWSGTQ